MTQLNRKVLGAAALAAALMVGGRHALADIPYLQNFETNTADWNVYDARPGDPLATAGSVTQVSSGDGAVHAPSYGGGFHAEITNAHDAYDAGNHYGSGGYTFFGDSQQA